MLTYQIPSTAVFLALKGVMAMFQCLGVSLAPPKDLIICKDQVSALLKITNIRKAAGPDAVRGCKLKQCANQLSGVFSALSASDVCRLLSAPFNPEKLNHNSSP